MSMNTYQKGVPRLEALLDLFTPQDVAFITDSNPNAEENGSHPSPFFTDEGYTNALERRMIDGSLMDEDPRIDVDVEELNEAFLKRLAVSLKVIHENHRQFDQSYSARCNLRDLEREHGDELIMVYAFRSALYSQSLDGRDSSLCLVLQPTSSASPSSQFFHVLRYLHWSRLFVISQMSCRD